MKTKSMTMTLQIPEDLFQDLQAWLKAEGTPHYRPTPAQQAAWLCTPFLLRAFKQAQRAQHGTPAPDHPHTDPSTNGRNASVFAGTED